jgi:hypothetical protein
MVEIQVTLINFTILTIPQLMKIPMLPHWTEEGLGFKKEHKGTVLVRNFRNMTADIGRYIYVKDKDTTKDRCNYLRRSHVHRLLR